ncbi:MAG: phosphatase PAP2 family protein [Bacillaceae bacterium]
MDSIQKLDNTIIDFVHKKVPKSKVFDKVSIIINKIGYGGVMWVIVALTLILFTPYKQYGFMIILADFLYFILCNQFIKPKYSRQRPFQQNNAIEIIIKEPNSSSFPSGHATIAFSCTTILFFMNPLVGMIALVLSVVIACSRLYLLVHYPSDVTAGILIGIMLGLVSYLVVSALYML